MTMNDKGQSRATLILFFLFFLGLTVTLSALVDLRWTHLLLVKDSAAAHPKQESR